MNAQYKKQTREDETNFEHQRRLEIQEMYRQKDKKSHEKWAQKLANDAQWHKKMRETEKVSDRRKRLKDKIDYQNWRQSWSR